MCTGLVAFKVRLVDFILGLSLCLSSPLSLHTCVMYVHVYMNVYTYVCVEARGGCVECEYVW